MSLVVVKTVFEEDIRRFKIKKDINFTKFTEMIVNLYDVDKNDCSIGLKYKDDEDDFITITSQEELSEAFRFCEGSILRLFVSKIERTSPQNVIGDSWIVLGEEKNNNNKSNSSSMSNSFISGNLPNWGKTTFGSSSRNNNNNNNENEVETKKEPKKKTINNSTENLYVSQEISLNCSVGSDKVEEEEIIIDDNIIEEYDTKQGFEEPINNNSNNNNNMKILESILNVSEQTSQSLKEIHSTLESILLRLPYNEVQNNNDISDKILKESSVSDEIFKNCERISSNTMNDCISESDMMKFKVLNTYSSPVNNDNDKIQSDCDKLRKDTAQICKDISNKTLNDCISISDFIRDTLLDL